MIGTNVIDVAADAVVAKELDTELVAQLAVPNVDPLWVPINDPVNDPVLICRELDTIPEGNPVGNTYELVIANDAVAGVNVIDVAADAVVAKELDTTLVAQLAVPNKDPVNDPVNDPVLICAELDTVPVGNPVGSTYELVIADVMVPNNDPENEPLKDPVLICTELDTVPLGSSDFTCAELLMMFAGILLNPV